MYTSGWPKIQKRCCQSKGSAPAAGAKKSVPKKRSNMRRMSATVMAGKASTTRNCTTSDIQMKTGMRIRVMPGARMLTMVTMKLKPASMDAMPRICSPSIQKSMLWPAENCRVVSVE